MIAIGNPVKTKAQNGLTGSRQWIRIKGCTGRVQTGIGAGKVAAELLTCSFQIQCLKGPIRGYVKINSVNRKLNGISCKDCIDIGRISITNKWSLNLRWKVYDRGS